MQLKALIPAVAFILGAGTAITAGAQSTAAAGSVVVIPVVAQTASYTTEVTVQNPNAAPITLNVAYSDAVGTFAPGPATCIPLSVPALATVPFTLSAQCTLDPTKSHFGMLVLQDAAAQQTDTFFAYSRVQNPSNIGFSIEGFPIGAFSGAPADVVGIKRTSAAPSYQSNCFVGALGEAINYQIILRDGTTNGIIGSPITGTLQPYELVRYLDVFGATGANAPAGDYTNVRANFTATTTNLTPGFPAFVGFCTVQDNTYYSNDFRIAKSTDALSDAAKRIVCFGQDSCGAVSVTNPETITGVTTRNVYSMIVTQPDFVACNLVAASADLANLQMRIRGPGAPFGTTVWPSSAPYDSGGAGKTSFYISTGPRNAVNNGTATRWFIDVEQTSTSTATGAISYGITCQSGNGTEVPWFRGTAAAF